MANAREAVELDFGPVADDFDGKEGLESNDLVVSITSSQRIAVDCGPLMESVVTKIVTSRP